ncbi:unnamed protein product [Durusdinium trenchii]|uniref:C2 domain-containing protein n=1 Tax=Durusdinium trenchii TaxID=1381693 RepID=A0ABP0SLI7_9DINO
MPIEAEAFSPWLCLAAPHLSSDDPNSAFPRAAPYAVLQLFIDRAHALPAADLNGLSDPYVTAQINDQDLQVRTTTQNGTLAPRWGEEFHIPVYRPESVLTLYVHDEDFGTENIVGFAGSLVGLSDDLLGCVDISLERLPLNTKLSGWFDLHSVTKATSYRTRVALSESGEAQTVGRIRLQLTLRVQQPQDELYALCLGPPSFGEPLQPLNFGELMTHVSSIARVLGRVGDFCGPLVTRAERFSSLVFGTAIFLVWRPHFILPLLIVKFCVVLLLSQPVPTEVSESAVSDPKLQQVFKAAEVGLAAQQYTEISMAQNQLGTCVSTLHDLQETWAKAVAHKRAVSFALGLVALALVHFREWQGFVLRTLLTIMLAFFLAQNSCVARVLRALYIYKYKDTSATACLGMGVTLEAINLRSDLKRSGTCVLTPGGAASLSNSSQVSSNVPEKVSMHVLEEETWTEPAWCQHCGGFLWGAWRQNEQRCAPIENSHFPLAPRGSALISAWQGWKCRDCAVVLCHACAAESDLDFCAKSQSKPS